MATKSELQTLVQDLQQQINSQVAERALFHTELGKIALTHNCEAILQFLNFSPDELKDLKETMDWKYHFEQVFQMIPPSIRYPKSPMDKDIKDVNEYMASIFKKAKEEDQT